MIPLQRIKPEFNEQEQEALKIGEQADADQQQLLAGKFKDPEALEQAYLELQSKLGQPREEPEAEPEQQEPEGESEEEYLKMMTILLLKRRHNNSNNQSVEKSATMK